MLVGEGVVGEGKRSLGYISKIKKARKYIKKVTSQAVPLRNRPSNPIVGS